MDQELLAALQIPPFVESDGVHTPAPPNECASAQISANRANNLQPSDVQRLSYPLNVCCRSPQKRLTAEHMKCSGDGGLPRIADDTRGRLGNFL